MASIDKADLSIRICIQFSKKNTRCDDMNFIYRNLMNKSPSWGKKQNKKLVQFSSHRLPIVLVLVFSKCFRPGFQEFSKVQVQWERGHKFIKIVYHVKFKDLLDIYQ